jgi:hypothetical protein
MKMKLPFLLFSLLLLPATASAQRRPGPPPGRPGPGGGPPERGPRPEQLGESEAELGSSGIVWYPILDDGLAEAKRTGKPILFMSVSSSCGGISGVF